jgi:hypothetical protein
MRRLPAARAPPLHRQRNFTGRPGFEAAVQADATAIETFAASLAGSGKPMLVTGATLTAPGRAATERDELIAAGPIAARIRNLQAALAAAERDVRACLVMLPRSVHGQGERHGFVPQLIALARAKPAGLIEDIEQATTSRGPRRKPPRRQGLSARRPMRLPSLIVTGIRCGSYSLGGAVALRAPERIRRCSRR